MVDLIANPELYDGRRIQTQGFLSLEFEDHNLYLNRESWDYRDMTSRIGLWLPPEVLERRDLFHGKVVVLQGRFEFGMKGIFGLPFGIIDDIDRVEALPSRELWEKREALERELGPEAPLPEGWPERWMRPPPGTGADRDGGGGVVLRVARARPFWAGGIPHGFQEA